MRIHCQRGLAESHIQHHIGGFAPHAGQGFQRRAAGGHFAPVFIHQNMAGSQQVFGFAAVQAYGFERVFELFQA